MNDLSGEMESSRLFVRSLQSDGPSARYLRNKGFGWMLEVEEGDADSDKPLLEELDIDLPDIIAKTRSVLLPVKHMENSRRRVRESPDFWGPLLIVLLYAILSLYGQFRVVSWIVTMWLSGAFVIYVIARSLGGEVIYAQCVGIIGYCLLPLFLVCCISPLFGYGHPLLATVFRLFGVAWSSFSASSLLWLEELQKKRWLLVYPISLLYIYFLSLYTGA